MNNRVLINTSRLANRKFNLIKLKFQLCSSNKLTIIKDDFQSLLRSLRVCFRFCFEFVDMLHFGNSIHEVFESAITGRYV